MDIVDQCLLSLVAGSLVNEAHVQNSSVGSISMVCHPQDVREQRLTLEICSNLTGTGGETSRHSCRRGVWQSTLQVGGVWGGPRKTSLKVLLFFLGVGGELGSFIQHLENLRKPTQTTGIIPEEHPQRHQEWAPKSMDSGHAWWLRGPSTRITGASQERFS